MKTIRLGLLILVACAATSAKANLIEYDTYFSGVLGNPSAENNWAEGVTGVDPLSYLAKYDTDEGNWENGAVSNSYFDLSVYGDTAKVGWDLTGTGFLLRYVLIKSGMATNPRDKTERGHLYSLFEVTEDQYTASGSMQDLYFGWAPDYVIDKGISHVTFLGTQATSVPEPSALLLFSAGLLGVAALRRRRRIAS